MTTSTSSPQATAQEIVQWLQIAPSIPVAIVGTLPSGSTGGNLANITWQSTIPTQPAYVTDVTYEVTLTVDLTLPAGGSATFSPFAPWSIFSQEFNLGGSQGWNFLPFTAFYLDSLRNKINYDPNYPGLGNNSEYFGTVLTEGPFTTGLGGAGSLTPGQVVTNSGTTSATTTYAFTFRLYQKFQRMHTNLWGAFPIGDASFPLTNSIQLNPLVGTDPQRSAFVNVTTGGTAETSGTTYVTAVYNTRALNASVTVSNGVNLPSPKVVYGLQVNEVTQSINTTNSVLWMAHNTAMLYTYLASIFINDQAPFTPSAWGIGPTQVFTAARTMYLDTQNTFNEYFARYQRIHGRYPLEGVMEWDLERGDFPPISSVTPFQGWMTPNVKYAAEFGIPATPAMATFYKVPSSVTLNNATLTNYSFGLVNVDY